MSYPSNVGYNSISDEEVRDMYDGITDAIRMNECLALFGTIDEPKGLFLVESSASHSTHITRHYGPMNAFDAFTVAQRLNQRTSAFRAFGVPPRWNASLILDI